MQKYATFDMLMLEAMQDGCNTQAKLVARLGYATKPFQTSDRSAMRVIDMRLQALRKAGKIKYGRNDCEVVKTRPENSARRRSIEL